MQYARTVRAATMVEVSKDYVRAARVIGLPSRRIMMRHILPNVMSPVMVIATINLAAAVLTEATLSFLGVGMPPTYPSLGTLIRIGNEFVFSGIWWIAVLPAAVLVVLVLAVNVVGDWLRDRFNPKLDGTMMMHTTPLALDIRNLRVEYPLANGDALAAVDDVDAAIAPGEIHALVGRVRRGQDARSATRSWACCRRRAGSRPARSPSPASRSTPAPDARKASCPAAMSARSSRTR